MKVKEIEEKDKFGEYPCCWLSGKDAYPQNIHEWLYRNYQGYKFAIVFDCTKDVWEEPEKETPVYFADSLLDEIAEYIGVGEAIERLQQRQSLKEDDYYD